MDMGEMTMDHPMSMPEKASATMDSITVTDAYARATTDAPMGHMDMGSMPEATPEAGMAMGGMNMDANGVSAAYMHIENASDQPDVLLSVTSDVSDDTQVHQTIVDAAGVAKMEHMMGGIEIPAQGSIDLAPGGYHVMMMNLKRPLAVGETIQLTLNFQSGVVITFEVPVMPVGS